MKRGLIVVLACFAAFAAAPGDARAGQCGIPSRSPLWIDFADGSVPFWPVFAKPGVIAAASNFIFPAQLRAAGAKTVYFDLHLNNRVGTPTNPVNPALIDDRAHRLYFRAIASTGCNTPWIALNELFGSSTTTPWTVKNAQYRANVLAFMRALSARGARPFLLLSTRPYTAGDAGLWWRQAADAGELVREVYFPAPQIHKQGPILGSRTLRSSFRRSIIDLTEIGVPISKIGIFLGFHTGRGQGGREALKPAHHWFRHVKLQALAMREVATELPVHTIWSWGWASWGEVEKDPDKEPAACVYLWTRDPRLCNGPAVAGPEFNASLTEGQIRLPNDVQCKVGPRQMGAGELSRLAALTGDRQAALTALLGRISTGNAVPLRGQEILAAERSVVAGRFGGSRAAYLAAIARAGVTPAMARAVIADELRQARVEPNLRVAAPSADEIVDYYNTYAGSLARAVEVRPAPTWLGGLTKGLALSSTAPGQILRLPARRPARMWTPSGIVKVRAFGRALPLGAFTLDSARAAIRAALLKNARAEAFQMWSLRQQKEALKSTICRRDELPAVGTVDLTNHLPFLALSS